MNYIITKIARRMNKQSYKFCDLILISTYLQPQPNRTFLCQTLNVMLLIGTYTLLEGTFEWDFEIFNKRDNAGDLEAF